MSRPPKAREPLKLAALELFVENGVHATGIREISRAAGCSEAALYRHWANKDDLVRSLFQEHMDEVVSILDAAVTEADSLAERVRKCAHAAFNLYDEQPLVFRFVLLVQHELARHLPEDMRFPQDVIRDLVRQAIADGECAGDVELHTAWLLGIFLHTAEFVLYGVLPGPLVRYTDDVQQTALRILAP